MIRSRNVVVGWLGNLIRKRGRGEEGVYENRSDMIFYSEFLLSYCLSCQDFSRSKGGGSCRIPIRAWVGKFTHQKLILRDKIISVSKFYDSTCQFVGIVKIALFLNLFRDLSTLIHENFQPPYFWLRVFESKICSS